MSIQVGDKVPSATFRTLDGGIQTLTTDELFGGKKVVLFGVPGPFTPTCNDTHFPGFLAQSDKLEAKGADTVACMAVADVFVMSAWAKALNAGEHVRMLADGNAEVTRALGLELDLSALGFGTRCKRFAMVVDDGEVTYLGVEPGKDVGVSSADAVLEHL